MIIILLGAPGSGKGTLAQGLQKLGIAQQVSTGDLFRREIAAQTPLGKQVAAGIAEGKLVSDEVTLSLVAREIKGDVILDGYPRTVKQTGDLDTLLAKQGKAIDLVVNLYADDDTIVDRVVNRAVCSKCHAIYNEKYAPPHARGTCDKCGGALVHRADDDERVVRQRLQVYREKTAQLIEFYRKRGLVLDVDSTRENALEFVARYLAKLQKR